MANFLNPFYFVPAKVQPDNGHWINLPHNEDPEAAPQRQLDFQTLGNASHHRYHEGTRSGCLVCELTTKTPTVFGATQIETEHGSKRILPFERGGKPAIPATTLKGRFASVAEAASCSSMRVLENTKYSRRVLTSEAGSDLENFSALGLVKEEDGKLRLLPLAMPSMPGRMLRRNQLGRPFKALFPELSELRKQLKANGASPATIAGWGPDEFREKIYIDTIPDNSTLASNTSNAPGPAYWYIDKGTLHNKNKDVTGRNTWIHLGNSGDGNTISHTVFPNSMRGFLRILQINTVRRIPQDIPASPSGIRHELFIPYPEGMEHATTYPIPSEALERFRRIASERKTENARLRNSDAFHVERLLPYHTTGREPFADRQNQYEIQDGDIVFFRPRNQKVNGEWVIDEVWVSQLWRREMKDSAFDSFKRISPELLPFNRERTKISPAEALFGFVEENTREEDLDESPSGLALAGRVQFHAATLEQHPGDNAYHNKEITLKILATPKPPCPCFYFKKNNLEASCTVNNCHIAKKDLGGNPQDFQPQGYKFYLNHNATDDQEILARASTVPQQGREHLHPRVTPLQSGCTFRFHIDFNNLSDWELGLLIYSLSPSEGYLHKMGFAKPLGLGSVEVKISELNLIDRQKRYSISTVDDLFSPRYHGTWTSEEENGDIKSPAYFRDCFMQDMDQDVKKAINIMGIAMGSADVPVCYPVRYGQDAEGTHFKWFVANDSHSHCGLLPLCYANLNDPASSLMLPSL